MLSHAVELAACGWQVLPLRGKVPWTSHGLDDATTDADQVRDWWVRWPSANIGARVPDALIVFDVYPRNGGIEGWRQMTARHEVPATLTVISGRGDGGSHRYFMRPSGPITAAKIPKGIDLKRSGYMVMPPSLHPETGRPYVWCDIAPVPLPVWLREVLRPAPAKYRAVTPGAPMSGRHLVEFVARQGDGNRNNALYWAAHRAIESGVLDLIEPDLIAAAVATGEDRDTAERTICSARSKGSV